MITTADFKKHIAKTFGQEMRLCGFKGTGFEYRQETDEYLIALYIDPSRWGGSCSAGFAIHPKQVNHDYYGPIDFEKLKTYQYEFRMSLAKEPNGPSWDYAEDRETNLVTLDKIVKTIKKVALPAIEQFKTNPSVMELFGVDELRQFHKNWAKRTGTYIATTNGRFAWAAALMLEKKNPRKAKEFAEWCLSQPNESGGEWFGTVDLKRVIASSNGA